MVYIACALSTVASKPSSSHARSLSTHFARSPLAMPVPMNATLLATFLGITCGAVRVTSFTITLTPVATTPSLKNW